MWEVASPLIRYALELAARNVGASFLSARKSLTDFGGVGSVRRRLSCGTKSVVVAAGFMTQ